MPFPEGGGRPPVLHCLMAAVLGIGAFALVVGAEPAFATHVGELTLYPEDTITDTASLNMGDLWSLETIKIGDKYYVVTADRAAGSRGIQILDITDPTNIRAAGQLNHTSGSTVLRNSIGLDFHQIGTSIYALTTSFQDKGMQITNITDPSNPTAVSRVTYPDCGDNPNIRGVGAVQIGDYHYAMVLSTGCGKFYWLNITNPASPALVFTGSRSSSNDQTNADPTKFTRLNSPIDVHFRQIGSEHFAYIMGADGGQVVDITNQSSPRSEGRAAGFGNEPRATALHQMGSKYYMIGSVASDDHPQIVINNVTDTPMLNSVVGTHIATITLQRNLQDMDIFELGGRTYLAVAITTGVGFVDITNPSRPFEVARVNDGVHGFHLFGNARDASAIEIGGEQYVAVGGEQGITLIHVRPYGQPIMSIVGITGGFSGTAPSFNVVLPFGTTELSFVALNGRALDADNTVTFNVTKAVYTKGHRVASSAADVHTFTFSRDHPSETVTVNMTHYPVKEVYLEEIRINATHNNYTTAERTHYVAHDWANEYALILITTNSTHPTFAGSPATSIYVTGATQSSPTEEGGVLRLPTALSLSLGQATAGEDAGTVNITATLDAPAPPDGVSVSLYSSGGNATEGTDYTLPASINIAAGERSGSASITITDDTLAESDESVTISTYVDILGQAMTDSITLTITDNDGATVAADQDNQPPTISSAISDATIVHEAGTRTISLSGVFSDADNDPLNVTATSSDATKAAVSVASDYTSLTLTAKARGISTITVTANDGNGGTISDTFTVTVKAAPAISSAISDISGMKIGDNRDISLGGVFSDADNDPLNVTASTSDYNIAEAIIFQNTLTIIAVSNGSATITVTAQDADGNRAADTFDVTVAAAQQQNRAPTISSAISDATIVHETGTKTISLDGVFSDADNDSLNVTATSSNGSAATVEAASDGSALTITARAWGTATVTVTANDGNGGTISDTFTVTVKAAPAISSAILDVSGLNVGDGHQVSLDGVFDDADGDSLTITATSSNGSVATVEAASDGSALTIAAQAPGTTTITVTAQDADGNQATDTFEVAVDAVQQAADTAEPESIVAQYDTDGSGIIEQDEWEVAMQDYTDGKLTNEEIYAISKARP